MVSAFGDSGAQPDRSIIYRDEIRSFGGQDLSSRINIIEAKAAVQARSDGIAVIKRKWTGSNRPQS